MPATTAHDGSELYYEVRGTDGPWVLAFVNPRPPRGPLGAPTRKMITALDEEMSGRYRVVLVDYPGSPKPDTLTPAAVTQDLLAVADAAGADRFAWWGYSWGAVIGLQLGARSDRVSALVCGGFPPLRGPYREMLTLTRDLVEGRAKIPVVKLALPGFLRRKASQFVTYYEGLQAFDDNAAQQLLQMPRLCYVGSEDHVQVNGEVVTSLANTVVEQRDALEGLGWDVVVVDGCNHRQAMAPDVFRSTVLPWLDSHVAVPR